MFLYVWLSGKIKKRVQNMSSSGQQKHGMMLEVLVLINLSNICKRNLLCILNKIYKYKNLANIVTDILYKLLVIITTNLEINKVE